MGLNLLQRLQRLAHRRVVRHAPRPVHPAVDPADLGPAADGRRGAPRREEGLPRGHVLGEPVQARLAAHLRRPLGPVLRRRARTRARSSACTSARRRRMLEIAPGAPIDVMITLTPLNTMQAATDLCGRPVLRKFPNLQFALSRGRHRLDPVLARAARLRVPAAPLLDRTRTSATQLPSQVARDHFSFCFISDRAGVDERDDDRRRHDHVGVRLPALRLDWPNSPESLAKQLDGVPDDEVAQDDPRERDADLPVRPVRAPAQGAEHRRRAAGRGTRLITVDRRHAAGVTRGAARARARRGPAGARPAPPPRRSPRPRRAPARR